MRVVLSPNPYRDRGLRAAQSARKILNNAGVETSVCLPFDLDGGSKVELPRQLTYEKMEEALPGAAAPPRCSHPDLRAGRPRSPPPRGFISSGRTGRPAGRDPGMDSD